MSSSITFRVNDVGVSSFIDKLKQKSAEATQQMMRDAKQQTSVQLEQIKLVEDKIKSIEKLSRLESQAAEQQIRNIAQQRIEAAKTRTDALHSANKGRLRSGEIDRDEYLAREKKINEIKGRFSEKTINSETEEVIRGIRDQAKSTQIMSGFMRESLQEERARTKKEDERGQDWKKTMLAMANGVMIDRVGGMVSNIPNTKNELDYVKPMMSMLGMTLGGVIGSSIDALAGSQILGTGLGKTSFGQLGIQLGEKMGEFAGSAMERTYHSRDELTSSNYKLKALAGRNLGDVEGFGATTADGNRLEGRGYISDLNQNLERFGLSLKEVSHLQYEIATRTGSVKNLSRDTNNIAAMEKGWGVNTGTSMALLELVRSNREGDKDIQKIVGGALQKGQGGLFKDGDRAYLNEFLTRNYTQLQKALLSTQSSVASGTTFDIISKFNSLGGEFSAKDSRSSGFINTIQGALSNPGSDSQKALAFYTMRKAHPEMNLLDTQMEIQKGLGSASYYQSMMQQLTSSGGDETFQVNNIASMFGMQNNLAAVKKMRSGFLAGKFGGKFSTSYLSGSGDYSANELDALGTSQTSTYSKSTAEIENAFLESAIKGIGTVKNKMEGLFGDMIDELKIWIVNEIKGQITPGNNGNGVKTTTKYSTSKGNVPGVGVHGWGGAK